MCNYFSFRSFPGAIISGGHFARWSTWTEMCKKSMFQLHMCNWCNSKFYCTFSTKIDQITLICCQQLILPPLLLFITLRAKSNCPLICPSYSWLHGEQVGVQIIATVLYLNDPQIRTPSADVDSDQALSNLGFWVYYLWTYWPWIHHRNEVSKIKRYFWKFPK